MKLARKLRVVADCPVPEMPIRSVVYGAAPWGRLPHNPTADEITWRVRAQSLLTRDGKRAELPATKEEAMRIIAEHEG